MFTWKKRIHTHLMYERLDRTIAQNDWTNIYPNAIELHEVFTCSDHCPIVMTTNMNQRTTKAFPFCFQNFWCKFQSANLLVKNTWKMVQNGTNLYKLVRKLKIVKFELKDRAKKSIGNPYDELSKNAQKLAYVEERLMVNPNSYRFNSWLNRLLKQREKLLLFNQKYWGKLARREWR